MRLTCSSNIPGLTGFAMYTAPSRRASDSIATSLRPVSTIVGTLVGFRVNELDAITFVKANIRYEQVGRRRLQDEQRFME